MSEDDADRRMETCPWFLDRMDEEAIFLCSVFFSDEDNFYVKGEVSKPNLRHWSQDNHYWTIPVGRRDPYWGSKNVMV